MLLESLLAALDLVEVVGPRHAQANVDRVALSTPLALLFEFLALVRIERPQAALLRAVRRILDLLETLVQRQVVPYRVLYTRSHLRIISPFFLLVTCCWCCSSSF